MQLEIWEINQLLGENIAKFLAEADFFDDLLDKPGVDQKETLKPEEINTLVHVFQDTKKKLLKKLREEWVDTRPMPPDNILSIMLVDSFERDTGVSY